jgi:transposase
LHRPRKCTFTDGQVLAVQLWAALHDRPVNWATRRESWPAHDRTRALPTPATMSRRLRSPRIGTLLDALIAALRLTGPGERTLIVDGRALRIAWHSGDPDASFGRAGGGMGLGYKLHEIVDLLGNCRCFRVEPMNVSEQRAAESMLGAMGELNADVLLADANYDSNRLYEAAGRQGAQLLTPRRYPEAKGLGHHRHSAHRLRAIELLRSEPERLGDRRRIESCFASQGNRVGGLGPLPNFVRRLHRVRLWVAAKLAIDAAHRKKDALAQGG